MTQPAEKKPETSPRRQVVSVASNVLAFGVGGAVAIHYFFADDSHSLAEAILAWTATSTAAIIVLVLTLAKLAAIIAPRLDNVTEDQREEFLEKWILPVLWWPWRFVQFSAKHWFFCAALALSASTFFWPTTPNVFLNTTIQLLHWLGLVGAIIFLAGFVWIHIGALDEERAERKRQADWKRATRKQ